MGGAQTPLVGKKIKDCYYLLERLGGGGDGTVYLARDEILGKYWAVKEIPAHRSKEMRILKNLSHSMLPQIADYVQEDEKAYLVMEYIEGRNLEELRKEGPCSREQVIQWGIQLCQVLGYLHSRHPAVVHSDVKPSNLILTENQELYLIDLGSSVVVGEGRQRVGLCRGTREYAAPEQLLGRLGCTSDIYSLGRTLEVLAGGKKEAGDKLWRILKKCQALQEAQRYQDCQELERELRKAAAKNQIRLERPLVIRVGIFLLGGCLLMSGGDEISRSQGRQVRQDIWLDEKEEFLDVYTVVQNQIVQGMLMGGKNGSVLLEESVKRLRELLKEEQREREQAALWLALARVYRELGQTHSAERAYERALENDSGNVQTKQEYQSYLAEEGIKKKT